MRTTLLLLACACATAASARTVRCFNDGWSLTKDGKTAAVAVPHDWAIAGPFAHKNDTNTGALPWKGEGVYRKTFVMPARPKGRLFLDFDGVMARATVFVNGQPCGKGEYGYLGFRADATPYVYAGTNTVEVRCDTKLLSSRWYPGGGLYRDVRFVETDDVYLEDDSLAVETEDVLTGKAKVSVSGTVVSRRAPEAKLEVAVTLRDADGRVVAREEDDVEVDGYDEENFDVTLRVTNPRLWQMTPNAHLYTLEIALTGAGVADRLMRRIGLREFRFDADRGFILNGTRVQLNGVDLHSDLGPLGMAFDRDAMRRQLAVMRDMGANALRTSHNAPAPGVLDLCDEMGIFVWNECFDKWNVTCGRGDEPLEPFVSRVLAAWVRRDRLHPSVFCWSIGNEISPGKATPPGQENWWSSSNSGTSRERCARFRHVVRSEDETRPVTIGSCFAGAGVVERGDYADLDLTGWNYNEQYQAMRKRHPDKPLIYSESASALSEYGFYQAATPTNKTDFAWRTENVDSYDLNAALWSDIPDREFFRMERDRFCAGEFVWTGIDYLGEPTPYGGSAHRRLTPRKDEHYSRSSYFGICDLCALPKDRFYLYRAHWNREAFTLHLVPHHWNFPDKAGKKMPVYVYTSADEAELFLNGVSLGRRRKQPNAGTVTAGTKPGADYYSVMPRYRLIWEDVPYAPGELKTVAYGKDGRTLGEQVIRTAGAPARVVLTPERRYGRLCVVVVTLADEKGAFVPDESRRVRFAAEGCEILAVGNSNPRGFDSFKDVSSHPLCFGRAAVYVRVKDGVTGTLRASADGVADAAVELK